MQNRKIIQIAATPETQDSYHTIYALCDDGTLWTRTPHTMGSTSDWELVSIDRVEEATVVNTDGVSQARFDK